MTIQYGRQNGGGDTQNESPAITGRFIKLIEMTGC